MLSRNIAILTIALVAAISSLPTLAAEFEFTIPRIEGEPTLSDFIAMTPATELAHTMTKVEGFTQRLPDDGEAATQRTEVFVGYNEDTFFAIFLAFDQDPNQIRANLSSRENIDGDDLVELTIDTFNSQRTAFSFRSTPLGIQWDARWTEGSSRRAGFDTTLEAIWNSDGILTEEGYMVRMAIPLRSLRFRDGDEQLWRIQFARKIPRLSEETYWPPYSIGIEGRLNQSALMQGMRDVSSGNNYQIVPFLFTRELDVLDPQAEGGPAFAGSSEQDVGVDAKFIFNDSWILDLTLNPDFSQVESDQPQITANQRFEVRFPERRPFFVENADFFATDSTLVFTRRVVDPEGGLRFTGQQGNYGFGAILVNDAAPGLNRDSSDPLFQEKANIGIVRGFRDFGQQNRVGFLLTDRELSNGYNRVASVDGRFRLNSNWTSQAQLIETDTQPISDQENAYRGHQRNLRINRVGRTLNTYTNLIDTAEGFHSELGFQGRFYRPDTTGFRQGVTLNFFPEESGINRWSTAFQGRYLTDSQGVKIYSDLEGGINLQFDTTEYEIKLTEFSETLRTSDFPGLPTNRVYKYGAFDFEYENTTLNTLEFEFKYRTGTALNLVPAEGALPSVASNTEISVDALWRPIDRLRIVNTYLYTELESQANSQKIFSNEIARSNWNYQFTKEWSLRFIAQYENTQGGPLTRLEDEKNVNLDLLLRYVINPWSAFYVGYNSNSSNFDIVESDGQRELISSNSLRKDGDQFFIKFSYSFQR